MPDIHERLDYRPTPIGKDAARVRGARMAAFVAQVIREAPHGSAMNWRVIAHKLDHAFVQENFTDKDSLLRSISLCLRRQASAGYLERNGPAEYIVRRVVPTPERNRTRLLAEHVVAGLRAGHGIGEMVETAPAMLVPLYPGRDAIRNGIGGILQALGDLSAADRERFMEEVLHPTHGKSPFKGISGGID